MCAQKWPLGTEYFVRYSQVFVITEYSFNRVFFMRNRVCFNQIRYNRV